MFVDFLKNKKIMTLLYFNIINLKKILHFDKVIITINKKTKISKIQLRKNRQMLMYQSLEEKNNNKFY